MASSILFGIPTKPATAFAALVAQYYWCSQVHPNRGRGLFRPTKRSDLFCLRGDYGHRRQFYWNDFDYRHALHIRHLRRRSNDGLPHNLRTAPVQRCKRSLYLHTRVLSASRRCPEPVWRPDEHYGGGNAGATHGDSSARYRIDKSDRFAWTLPFGILASSRGTVALVCLRCTAPFSFCAPRMRLAGRALWPKKKSAPSANVLLGGIGCNLSRK